MQVLDITNIASTINKYDGLTKPSLFVVNITPPSSLINEGVQKDLMFFASVANLPGLQFTTEEYRPKGYGMPESKPTNVMMDDIIVNFFVDNKGSIQNFFHKWAQKQFNFDHNLSKSTSQGTPFELFAYPDQIWGTIDITQYSQAGDQTLNFNISKAYIKTIASVQLGWEQNDQLMFLPVTFGYKTWSTKATATNDVKYNTALDSLAQQRSASIINTAGRTPTQQLINNVQQQQSA